jgi:hypothetical protein
MKSSDRLSATIILIKKDDGNVGMARHRSQAAESWLTE